MAKGKHPAHKHIAAAKASMAEVMGHLKNIEQALGPGGDQQQPDNAPGGPPGAGMTMPDGSSPLGGKAG